MKTIAATIAILLGCAPITALASPGQVRAVNCRAAKGPAEVTICRDPNLRALDRVVVRMYASWLNRPGVAFNTYHHNWVSQRNACGADDACLRAAYRKRIWDYDHEAD